MFRFKPKYLSMSPDDFRRGQSTVELALLLPTIVLMLSFIIYAYKVNHKLSEQAHTTYSEKMYKFHMEGMVYDPVKGLYMPEGQYSELIPPDAMIDPSKLAGELGLQMIAQLGLSKLFDVLNIDTSTYGGAFAQGFTTSLASSAVTTAVQTGSLNDMNAQDLENATWAGGAAAFSSQSATEDFQGGQDLEAGKITGLQEFLGSGAQAGTIAFFNSHGDVEVAGASAVGGAINSDTTNEWISVGSDGKAEESNMPEILRGATKGAVQSSVSGIFGGNLDAKTVVVGAASGAVQTEAFADTLPLTGDDPKNSAMYGAFNGAFSSVVSGGDAKTTLLAAGGGALGSSQTSTALGEQGSFTSQAAVMVGGAGLQYISGTSLQAIGVGALTGAAGSGIGYIGNRVSNSLSKSFENRGSNHSASTDNGYFNAEDAKFVLNDEKTVEELADDEMFADDIAAILDGTVDGMQNAETLQSFEPNKVPPA
jgi:hypothetical protein